MATKTVRTCKNGHQFYKSSDCPTCPQCEEDRKPKNNFLTLLSGPARRAFERHGLLTLEKISALGEKEILALHGVGPATLPVLKKALAEQGLRFKK